ncbi:type II toxin-antitoxin system VapC family toxin [Candidatus Gottesmanbacteria bacterium]|nr:type II toxin-antitoxin system VapC family toxin [Candidatus Gottesmanbacteria bacterium]
MKYLVDTHIFLWWLNEEEQLKTSIKSILSDTDNIIYVSVVTAWEMSLKLRAKRKIKLKSTIEDCFQKAGFEILDIRLPHVLQLAKLQDVHKDPFDRMLIAQANVEEATLITGDEKIWKYDIPILRA